MSEPTIICPNCKTEIKLTESLAAPLIETTRRDYETRLAQKDTDIAKKEESLREREAAVSKATQAIDDQVAEKLLLERAKIVSEGASQVCRRPCRTRRRGSNVALGAVDHAWECPPAQDSSASARPTGCVAWAPAARTSICSAR